MVDYLLYIFYFIAFPLLERMKIILWVHQDHILSNSIERGKLFHDHRHLDPETEENHAFNLPVINQ